MEEKIPPVREVLCREDLPENPNWEKEGYPNPHCWNVYELFMEAKKEGKDSLIWQDARRLWWESHWRLRSKYKGGKPFFKVYMCDVRKKVCIEESLSEDDIKRILREIIITGLETGITPRGVGIFREVFGKL